MIGALLNNRYRLDAALGQGGMGVVYRGHDVLLERDVAVKVVSGARLGTEGRTRLLAEARAVAQLHDPHIVTIFDAGEAAGTPFIVMELLAGASLFDHKPTSLSEALEILCQVCAALEHAHEHGIVHRDLKPENVILAPAGAEPGAAVKLTDFGLARPMAARVSTEGTISGTVFYIAPEQALGQPVDGRADLYSLGVMLYELAAGRLPFVADDPLAVISQHLYAQVVPPSTHNAAIPPGLDALIVKLLSKQPADRPASAAEVGRALEAIIRSLAGGAAEMTPAAAAEELSPLDRLALGRLVGREREFGQARALWKQVAAATGDVRVLLLSGEPGVGKTPLVHEIMALAGVSGGQVLTAACYAEGSAPYEPVAQLVRAAFNLAPSPPLLPGEGAGGRGFDKAGERGSGIPAAAFADLLALAPDLAARYPNLPAPSFRDPQSQQQRLFEDVVALCASLSGRAPLLLVVEDIHWADGATIYLVRHLARRIREARLPMLLLLTYREADAAETCCLEELLLDLNRERLALHLRLRRFDRAQTRQVLATMFGQEIGPEFADSIYDQTEGNLFFIEEMCKALIESGEIYREAGHWQRRATVRDLHLPQSVRATIQARVGRLPEPAQEALRMAAIIGREFDFATLQRASEQDEALLVDALESAERAQLIGEMTRPVARGNGDGNGRELFAFAHTLIPTALSEGVSGLRRRRLHRRVATAIEALHPDDAAALAYHFGAAGDDGRAYAYYVKAGDRAAALYANEDAIRLYSEALELAQDDRARFDVLRRRCGVYNLIARRDAQRADAEAMAALAEQLNDDPCRCDALLALADFWLGTDYPRAPDLARRAVELARRLDDAVREAQALFRLGWASWELQMPLQARQALEAAVAHFRQAGRIADAANALHTLSLVLGSQGLNDLNQAQAAVEEAVALSRQAGDRRQEAHSLRRLAILFIWQARYAEALPHAEKALALHRELGDREGECDALNVMGLVLSWLRRPQESQEYLRRSIEVGEAIGLAIGAGNGLSNLIWLHYQPQGELEAALRLIEAHRPNIGRGDDQVWDNLLDSSKLDLLYHLGAYDEALALAQAMMAPARSWGGPLHKVWLNRFAALVTAERGEIDEAHRYLDRSRHCLEEAGMTQPEELGILASVAAHIASRAAAQVIRQGGDPEPALRDGLAQAEQALDFLAGVDSDNTKYHLAETHARRGRLHLALSELPSPAADALASALTSLGEALRLYEKRPLVIRSTELLYAYCRALRAAGRAAEAADYLRRACDWVMEVAGKTPDETLRRCWLENVRANQEVLAEMTP